MAKETEFISERPTVRVSVPRRGFSALILAIVVFGVIGLIAIAVSVPRRGFSALIPFAAFDPNQQVDGLFQSPEGDSLL